MLKGPFSPGYKATLPGGPTGRMMSFAWLMHIDEITFAKRLCCRPIFFNEFGSCGEALKILISVTDFQTENVRRALLGRGTREALKSPAR